MGSGWRSKVTAPCLARFLDGLSSRNGTQKGVPEHRPADQRSEVRSGGVAQQAFGMQDLWDLVAGDGEDAGAPGATGNDLGMPAL